ncbi:MAG: hypothetical protein ACSLFN_00215 [Candidatus Limnocylindrales bacterium]
MRYGREATENDLAEIDLFKPYDLDGIMAPHRRRCGLRRTASV